MKYTIIGMTDSRHHSFSDEVMRLIEQSTVFSGGKRHHELVADILPESAVWIDITVPLDDVFARYDEIGKSTGKDGIVIFASGDPLFFGFANTIRQRRPDAEVVVYPVFNSLQALAHRLVMPYHDMRIVSLTGRPWHEFDRALIERTPKIGVLTDRIHTPSAIAQRMIEYGYTSYVMHIGEHLGSDDSERITTLSISEAVNTDAQYPNCLILDSGIIQKTVRRCGLPDEEFSLLDGRRKMITKMPVRMVDMQMIEPYTHDMLIDVGYCTGSISIEAKLQFPHLSVLAIEVRHECESVIRSNTHRFGAPGINAVTADFMTFDLAEIEAVYRSDTGRTNPRKSFFIGGHNGHLSEMMRRISSIMIPDDVIVMNCVTDSSRKMFEDVATELCLHLDTPLRIAVDENNPIYIMKCRKLKS